MALSRETIDANRKLQGQPPISDEEFAALSNANGSLSDEEKAKLQGKDKTDTTPPTPSQDPPPVTMREPSEEELMQIVAQKMGKNISSWDDLKPQEQVDEQKLKEERDAAKISWGLQNKKIKPAELEGFNADSKNAHDLVYRLRLEAALKEDANLDEKEFREEFEEEFGLTLDKSTRRYKNGQDTLNRLANDILKTTYGSIYKLEDDFSKFETSQAAKKADEAKIKEGATAYKKTLENIRGGLKKISAQFDDKNSYEIEVLDDSIEEVLTMMSDPKFAGEQILRGYTEENLRDIAFTTVLKQNFPAIAQEIAKQHLYKHAAGTKGIPTMGLPDNSEAEGDFSDAQKKLIELHKQSTKPVPAESN